LNRQFLDNSDLQDQKYLIEIQYDPETGEVDEEVKHYDISAPKLNLDLELIGFYPLFPSEIEMSDKDIIHKYQGLSRIEDSVKITK
jgi:hypothetical protein